MSPRQWAYYVEREDAGSPCTRCMQILAIGGYHLWVPDSKTPPGSAKPIDHDFEPSAYHVEHIANP